MTDEDAPERVCENCSAVVSATQKYCPQCGVSLRLAEISSSGGYKLELLKQIGIFYTVELAICLAYDFSTPLQTLTGLSLFHVLSIINALAFISYNRTTVFPVLNARNLSAIWLLGCMALTVPAALAVNYTTGKLNGWLGESVNTYFFFMFYPYAKALTIFFSAVLPAVFEELAFRGFLLQILRKVVDDRQAIFISAFLFSIIHISFISLYWLLPFALILGYLCIKTNTIWYGVLIHFTFNTVSCLIDIYG